MGSMGFVAVLAVACVTLGCGDDSSDESGGVGSASGETTGGTAEAGTVATVGTTVSSASGSSGTSATTTTGGGSGFGCGPELQCNENEYCEEVPSNTGGRSSYFCRPLPEECAAEPTCDCLIEALCGDQLATCETTSDGGFITICPHG